MIAVTLPPAPDGPLPEAVRRARAIEDTRGKFEGRAFELGRNDCLQLVRFHLVAMGHARLPRPPKYRSVAAARRALLAQGVDSLAELVDKYLPRIAPAEMAVGDIALVEAEDDANSTGETLAIALGRKLWGWHPDQDELAVIEVQPGAIVAAWRA